MCVKLPHAVHRPELLVNGSKQESGGYTSLASQAEGVFSLHLLLTVIKTCVQ